MPYTLYVIELDPAVLQLKKFRDKNPDHRPDKRCVYVGMTSKTPEQRMFEHLTKARSKNGNKLYSTVVARYGKEDGLIKRLYRNHQNIPTQKLAEAAEKRLAERLRKRGYGVWGGA
jgi:hypothetical protein